MNSLRQQAEETAMELDLRQLSLFPAEEEIQENRAFRHGASCFFVSG